MWCECTNLLAANRERFINACFPSHAWLSSLSQLRPLVKYSCLAKSVSQVFFTRDVQDCPFFPGKSQNLTQNVVANRLDRLDGDEVFVEERTGDVFSSGAGDLECLRQGLQAISPGPDATGEATAIFMLAKTVVSR